MSAQAATEIGQHKMNERGKYACAHLITIVDIVMITAGVLSSLCAYVCVFLFIYACVVVCLCMVQFKRINSVRYFVSYSQSRY